MKLLSPHQMQEIDRRAIEESQIPGILLMEHAAYQIFSYLKEKNEGKQILIICGPGNNGGDGLALARQLILWSKCKVKVLMASSPKKLTEDGKVYYNICKNLQVDVMQLEEDNKEEMLRQIDGAHVVVDALFGTGLTRPIVGVYEEIITRVNRCQNFVISIDIPSGIDGLTGKIQGVAIKADVTITFMTPKLGLYLYPAISYIGELRIVDIGIPKRLIEETKVNTYSIEKEEMKELLPKRPIRSNKGTFGKVLTIGGKLGMAGAITLTSKAAYQVGCGTVTAMVPRSIIEIIQHKLTEVMAIGAPDIEGHFSKLATSQLKEILSLYDVVAIGPGMGRNRENLDLLVEILVSDKPCVIDADALYFVPEVLEILKVRKAPTILTPHPGEMARLTHSSVQEILDNPLEYATNFATQFNVITILKLEKTVIADTSGNIYINRYGNSGLAKGGSGDALTGMITGLMAQHMKPVDAAKLGVYLQTRAADLASDVLSEYSLLASDTIHFLSQAILELLAD